MSRRIFAAFLALTMVTLIGLCIPLGFRIAAHDRRIFCLRIMADTDVYAGQVEGALRRTPAPDPGAGSLSTALLPHPMRDTTGGRTGAPDTVELYDRTGRLVAGSGRPTEVSVLELREVVRDEQRLRYPISVSGGRFVAAAPVRGAAGVLGVVVVGRSDAPLRAETRSRWAMIAIGGGVVALGALVAALALTRWVARPLRRVEQAVQALGQGRLATRARTVRGPSEVRALAGAFDEMAARIESLVHGQRTLLGDVSHQLRTPLAAMRLRLELLAQDVDGPVAGEVNGVLTEVARLARLVDGLLAVARAEHAPAALELVDVASVIEDRVVAWLPAAADAGVELSCDLHPPQAPDVGAGLLALAAPGHLEQILDNLVCNALAASPRGGSVVVGGRSVQPATVRVTVADDGPGMSASEREHALIRYRTAGVARDPASAEVRRADRGGSGLGLTIVATLVAADGGRVRLARSASGGLLAVVELAAGREQAAGTPVPDVSKPAMIFTGS
ncbi:HAMP domain-containing histidine kinase [Frankia sp. Ag45/Mut15]|uniref:Signal transduction histidine-protein kinase/phosphatase MprB n=1 Tax=Frankia umida TaxID=573489 RepID=A0ABT0JXH5_9ACTN|nr:HAMP domain-containing sensor histidine kinase [Frankia umida]MCK9875703.1 HAMP domain-containing histidine kinase [Frankia umida]